MRPKVPAVFAAVLLVACTSTTTPAPGPSPGPADLVEAMVDYRSYDVPATFQHLVDWHTGTQPVVLLISAGGRRACAITPIEATTVIIGRPYSCRWSGAR